MLFGAGLHVPSNRCSFVFRSDCHPGSDSAGSETSTYTPSFTLSRPNRGWFARARNQGRLPEPARRKLVGRYRNGVHWKARWAAKFYVRHTPIKTVINWLSLPRDELRFELGHNYYRKIENNYYTQALINISLPTTYRWDNDTHMDEESLPNLGPLDNRLLGG